MDHNLLVSNWIWVDEQEHVSREKPCIVYFRKEFYSADKLRISANCRYKLSINGQFVQEGPQRSDGILQASAPAVWVNVIPGFSIFYILMLHDHMMYFGDKALIREHFGCMDRVLEYFNSHLTDKGLVGMIEMKKMEGRLMKYLVIDIGGTFTKYAITDADGEFLEKGKVPTQKESQTDFLEMIVELFERRKEAAAEKVGGIAISSAGVIDSKRGYMKNAGSLYCVDDLYICDELSRRCGVPVSVENDAKCAALAEIWKGSLKDCNDAAVMIVGTALGGAVIHDKKIVQGKDLMAGEFSYILVNSEEPENPEMTAAMYCGVPALLKLVAKAKNMPLEAVSGELVFEWVNNNDMTVQKVLHEYARRLAIQILNWQFIFNPEKVAVGGGISEQPVLLKYIGEELEKLIKVYPYPVPIPEVVNCSFYNDANLIGALYVLLQNSTQIGQTR